MELQILVRGQSNAVLFAQGDGWAGAGRLTTEVERLLGFDGVNDKVTLIYSNGEGANGTAHSGTAFLGEWTQRGADGAWRPASLQTALLRSAEELDDPAAAATSVLWLHSEFDSRREDLTPGEWTSAVRQDAALLRGVLGGDAASIPYHFVSAHPYGSGTAEGHQAIRIGMEQLAADPAFNARIAARALDIDASLDDWDGNWQTVEYGGAHITRTDALLIAERAARTIAEDWSEYARPGSPVFLAGGDVADVGPRVVSAERIGPDTLRLQVAHDATGGFAPLDADAAAGVGWEALGLATGPVGARSAVVRGPDTLDVSFDAPLPEVGALHYGRGYGRLAEGNAPGQGNAVLDQSGLPIWTPAEGVAIGAPPAPQAADPLWLQ